MKENQKDPKDQSKKGWQDENLQTPQGTRKDKDVTGKTTGREEEEEEIEDTEEGTKMPGRETRTPVAGDDSQQRPVNEDQRNPNRDRQRNESMEQERNQESRTTKGDQRR